MIELSGGHYVFKDSDLVPFMGGYCNITLEKFLIQGKDSDIYVFEAGSGIRITSIEKLIAGADILSDIKPILKGNVWISQPGYWQALDRMDEIILDLAAVFHPDLFPDHKPRYFRQLPKKDG
jgi:iron complex transport system substrate-binding protein